MVLRQEVFIMHSTHSTPSTGITVSTVCTDYYKYLGVPFKFNGNSIQEGYDCINLCCAIAKDRNISMKNINHSFTDIDTYHGLFSERDSSEWLKVDKDFKDALVVFKINGKVSHVGYMLDDYSFVHIMENSRVTVEKLTSPQWERRVIGFYRYIGTLGITPNT